MISDIKELNFPEYATLDGATVTLQDMAEGTITAQVKMDGEITPDFSQDWAVEFKGHKFIMPLREPQGAKENTSLMATVDLTFQHWAVWQLKRWPFFTVQLVESGTVMPDKYIASVSLNLGDFCKLTGQVLGYYYGDSITIDLNPQWVYASAPTNVEISHSHVWDVLIKLYELYGVRWQMMPNGDAEHYVIKVGYKATEIDHIFEYGFEGGLLKVERQVQNENIRNMLYGRGGEKNLPYRYYKNVDADNHTFAADPDWVPELANVSFTELRGATFRSYVQGWKAKHYGGTATRDKAYAPWAWDKGYTDAKFDPVEYVKDDRSIARYGELMDGLDNNEDIYPTIQGVDPSGDNPDIGRVDEAVYVEQVQSDDVQQSTALTATATLSAAKGAKEMSGGGTTTIDVRSGVWKVPDGAGNGYLNVGAPLVIVRRRSLLPMSHGFLVLDATKIVINTVSVKVWDVATGAEHSTAGLEGGKEYYFTASVNINNTYDDAGRYYIDLAFEDAKVVMSGADGNAAWGATFDVLVKNIWGTSKRSNETSAQYAERVWGPILGDRLGNEAKMAFSDGMLSLSEDYEFVITAMPKYESKLYSWQAWENGAWVTKEYMSEWRITLAKSDAEMETTGLYVPSTRQQGKAGDHFYFVGIDMPHEYVVWAEERLDDWKKDNLREVSEIKPTWVVTTDRVRLNNEGKAGALIDEIVPGRSLRLADKRFILNEESSETAYETLYVQSVTYTYRKPTKDDAALNPDVEIVLSDKYETVANPVETISGEVSALSRYVGSLSGMEQVARMVGDKLYLRKDGISDRSQSPTEFGARIGSVGFRQGLVGGKGWGVYEDDKGNVVVEADIIHARQGIEANEFVVNQTVVQGGKYVESAAWMEVSEVSEASDGYICYFDRKGGSVKNLFMTGDVAMSEVFTPELSRMKFYKRRVVMVGEDFIKLAKEGSVTTRPSDWPDSGVNGTGVPAAGDVISHYGSYANPDRQFVKVRDVIGGGYERYIEGLDSVDSDGTEYYFVGRQSGMYNGKPRFYIGDDDGYVEWTSEGLAIKGKLSVLSQVGNAVLGDAITESKVLFLSQASGADVPPLPIVDENGAITDFKGWGQDAPIAESGKSIWQTTMSLLASGEVRFSKPVDVSGKDGEYQANLLSGTRSDSWQFGAHGTDPGIAYRQELTDGRREDIFTQQGGGQQPNWHTAYFTSYCETLEAGKEYEVSFDAKGVAANVNFAVSINTGGNIIYPGSVIAQTSEEWRRTSLKFTMPEGNVWALAITVSLREDGEMRMRDIMIAPKGYAKWAPSFLDLKGTDGKNGMDAEVFTLETSVEAVYKSASDELSTYELSCTKYITVGTSGRETTTKNTLSAVVQRNGVDGEETVVAGVGEATGIIALDKNVTGVVFALHMGDSIDGTLQYRAEVPVVETLGGLEIGGVNLIKNSDKEFNAVKEAEYELAEAMVNGVSYTFTLWPHPEDAQFAYTWRVVVVDEDGAEEQVGTTTKSPDGRTTVLKFNYTRAVKSNKLIVRTSRGDYRGIFRVKLEQGNVSTDWNPSPYDLMDNSMDYIKGALKENTEIQNGLVLTSNVQVGYTDALGNRVTMAGMNGIISDAVGEKSLVFWGGGKQIDAALNPLDGAAMGVRADGSAYFAKNTVRMLGSEMQLGDNVVVSSKGMSMSDGNGNRCLVIQPQEIGFSPTNSLQGIKYDDEFLNDGVLSYYIGTSQTSQRRVQMEETLYTIGTISAGAKVTGTVALRVRDVTATGASSNQKLLSSSVVKVELCHLEGSTISVLTSVESSTLQWRSAVESSSNGVDVVRWSRSVDLNWESTGTVGYNLVLRVSVTPANNSSYPTFVSSKSCQVATEISLDITGSDSRCTVLGANGFAAMWGNAKLIATEDGAAIGFGDKYIRIDASGIKINRGAGEVDL